MKNNYILQSKISEKNGILLHNFANLFHVWLNERQMAVHNCFCIQPVAMLHIMGPLENATVCLKENESEKAPHVLSI